MLKKELTIDNIARQVTEILAAHIKVERLILYGSYAYGKPRQESDFDIAVISKDFKAMPLLKRMELFSRAALSIDPRIELKGFHSGEFSQPEKGSLLEMIKNKGKAIYP